MIAQLKSGKTNIPTNWKIDQVIFHFKNAKTN